jgi:ABC-type oligopeptide transport system ATPase subunit
MSERTATTPLLEVRDLVKSFPLRSGRLSGRGAVQAIAGIDLDIARGETVSLVGESGCGKSTTARCIVRILEPTSGAVRFDGVDLTTLGPGPLRSMRRRFQMVF